MSAERKIERPALKREEKLKERVLCDQTNVVCYLLAFCLLFAQTNVVSATIKTIDI